MVPPCSDRVSRAPPYSRTQVCLPVPGYHRLRRAFPDASGSHNPRHWPGPRSLAATSGVSVDVLSSGYLDVSVRRVRPVRLWIHRTVPPKRRVSPFGNPRISACSQLPEAYRSVLRPSSPLGAKAFTRCPCLLDPLRAVSNARMARAPPRRAGPGRSARLSGEHAGPSSPQRRQNMVSNSNTPA